MFLKTRMNSGVRLPPSPVEREIVNVVMRVHEYYIVLELINRLPKKENPALLRGFIGSLPGARGEFYERTYSSAILLTIVSTWFWKLV